MLQAWGLNLPTLKTPIVGMVPSPSEGAMQRKRLPRKITRLVRALVARDRGAQTRIAELLELDRSTVAHWFAEDGEREYSVPVDALAVICDALDTVAPLQAIADELGFDMLPKSRPTPSTLPVSSGTLALLGAVSRLGIEVEERIADGTICEEDSAVLLQHLDALIAIAQRMRARLPRPS